MNELTDKTFTIDSQKIEMDSKRVVDSILGVNSGSEQLVETLRTRIITQKDVIIRLEKDLNKLEKKSRSLKPGPEGEALKTQLTEVKQLLEGERSSLANLESKLNIVTDSIRQLVSVRKVLHTKIIRMKSTGHEDSAQYKEMFRLAGEAEKLLCEVNIIMNNIGGNLS